MLSQKIQKVLANLGIASRREVERMIQEGRVSINNRLAQIGDRVSDSDQLHVDGERVRRSKMTQHRILIYHKPVGEICTQHDPEKRPTVFDNLPPLQKGRWIMVGRLDINSSGLLLFTTDGEEANRLMHPSSQIEREYKVRVLGEVTPEIIAKLCRGVRLEEGWAKFKSITPLPGKGANRWYQIVLTEGKNREVRRLFESQNLKVSRLIRIRYGSYRLPKTLLPGHSLILESR